MSRPARENVREKIIEAAEKRLWHYGYKKTTIDEIAADAGVGKGTVYLHFENKEDVYSAIVAQYKAQVLSEQERIAGDPSLNSCQKLRQCLKLPVLTATERCASSPQAMEMVDALRPQLAGRLQPLIEKEARLLTRIVREGAEKGEFSVADPAEAARSLKMMTMGFMPTCPHAPAVERLEVELDRIIELAYQGLRK